LKREPSGLQAKADAVVAEEEEARERADGLPAEEPTMTEDEDEGIDSDPPPARVLRLALGKIEASPSWRTPSSVAKRRKTIV
jgi:hypothetical protein